MQVEGQHEYLYLVATGARVRNAYATYLIQEYSPEKFGLILHGTETPHGASVKASAV